MAKKLAYFALGLVHPCRLNADSLRYHARTAPLDIDSSAGPAVPMILLSDTPGKYVGLELGNPKETL